MLAYKVMGASCEVGGLVTARLGFKMQDPIFIIGTGRCGTTLLVSILGSHKQLATYPDEANDLWHPSSYPYSKRSIETPSILEDPEKFSVLSVEHWPLNQEKRIRNTFSGFHLLRGPSKHCIIKSAMISFLVPKILSIFPGARFIHVYRSGPPVVESLLKKEWDKYRSYFNSKSEFRRKCAKYWNDCILEIEKQKSELSLDTNGTLLELSYEHLCEDPHATVCSLGAFLNVAPTEFSFNVSKISSRNFKAGDYYHDAAWVDALQIMDPAMKLKGYALETKELAQV